MIMETQNKFKLYLGRNIGDAGYVSDDEMTEFIDAHIVPVFDGFTTYDVIGYWEGEQENCVIVEIITANNKLATLDLLRTIANKYKEQFHQDAVLLTREPVDMELV